MVDKPSSGAKPLYLGHRERLRERFLKSGFAAFSKHEIIELLLTLAIPRCDVKPAAKALLAKFRTIRGVLDAPVDELQKVEGIGPTAAASLRIMREIADLYLQQRAEQTGSLADSEALVLFWRTRIGALPNEVFEVGYLDAGYRLLRDGIEKLEEGISDRATVYPKRVIEAAVRRKAAAIVCAHNHPNGLVQPSEQDKLLTRALVLAAATVQIKVHDHLIVTSDDYFSFRKARML